MVDGMEKYAAWLEGFCREVADSQPEKIGVVCLYPDGSAFTAYYGEVWHGDKANMAYNIQVDAMMDVVRTNAKLIVDEAEEQEEGCDEE